MDGFSLFNTESNNRYHSENEFDFSRLIQSKGTAALLAVSFFVGFIAFEGLVVSRRILGEVQEPLSLISFVLVVALISCMMALARMLWDKAEGSTISFLKRITFHQFSLPTLLCSVSLILFPIILSIPGTSWFSILLGFSIVLTEELWVWREMVIPRLTPYLQQLGFELQPNSESRFSNELLVNARSTMSTSSSTPISFTTESANNLTNEPSQFDDEAEDAILYQVTSFYNEQGEVNIAGNMRVQFEPGQRTAFQHIAFCPAFATAPSIDIQQVEGPDARIKISQCLSHGMRVEIKLLNEELEATSIGLEFFAAQR